MAQPVSVLPVKLFVAALYREASVLEEAISQLRQTWGDTDFISQDFRFEATDYYEEEMGKDLFRRFYSFRKLISPDQIVECKLHSNQIEQTFANNGMRRINLDPGYIDYYKLVLASAKFGGQKIYLREGIYGDMTLVMYKGKWKSFTWGFPDFKSGSYDSVLSTIRNLYKTQVKEKSASD